MDITNLSDEHYEMLNKWAHKDILETLYLADTYGTVKPDELSEYFEKFRSYDFANISFHAHNETEQALSNSLKAIDLGAFSIDVSQDGSGINGGNLLYSDLKARAFLLS